MFQDVAPHCLNRLSHMMGYVGFGKHETHQQQNTGALKICNVSAGDKSPSTAPHWFQFCIYRFLGNMALFDAALF